MSVSCHLFYLVANKETNSSLSYSYIQIAHVTKMWLKCFFFFLLRLYNNINIFTQYVIKRIFRKLSWHELHGFSCICKLNLLVNWMSFGFLLIIFIGFRVLFCCCCLCRMFWTTLVPQSWMKTILCWTWTSLMISDIVTVISPCSDQSDVLSEILLKFYIFFWFCLKLRMFSHSHQFRLCC